eukprot:GDKJ01023665.1.p1 GENE.GDKJ01023665.1~~GDKJ01023665.1.p1  ORF type:complete len:118 (+),score=33.14 GDKJ01023665.1:394-747(+)
MHLSNNRTSASLRGGRAHTAPPPLRSSSDEKETVRRGRTFSSSSCVVDEKEPLQTTRSSSASLPPHLQEEAALSVEMLIACPLHAIPSKLSATCCLLHSFLAELYSRGKTGSHQRKM